MKKHIAKQTIAEFARGYPFRGKVKNDFNPFAETEYCVEEIRFSPNRTARRLVYILPGEITPANVHRLKSADKQRVKKSSVGKTTQLTKSQFLAVLLLRNEILACISQAVSLEGLKRAFRREFGEVRSPGSTRYFDSFKHRRYNYNNGILYKGHRRPPLYCWHYNEDGYIKDALLKDRILSFKDCVNELKSKKFADPRFFAPDFLETVRDSLNRGLKRYAEWHVPSRSEVHTIEAEIRRPVYDSIEFPDGYTSKD